MNGNGNGNGNGGFGLVYKIMFGVFGALVTIGVAVNIYLAGRVDSLDDKAENNSRIVARLEAKFESFEKYITKEQK